MQQQMLRCRLGVSWLGAYVPLGDEKVEENNDHYTEESRIRVPPSVPTATQKLCASWSQLDVD